MAISENQQARVVFQMGLSMASFLRKTFCCEAFLLLFWVGFVFGFRFFNC